MAMPAVKYEPEDPLEDRVARLEVNVEHIQKDVSEMKAGIRRLTKIDVVDQKLTAKIEAVDQRPTGKIDSSKDPLTTTLINIEKEFDMLRRAQAVDRVWFIFMTGGMFAIMAREFNWI